MTNKEKVVNLLQSVYPRALSYSDIMRAITEGGNSRYSCAHPSGKILQQLVKADRISQITVGYYCAKNGR